MTPEQGTDEEDIQEEDQQNLELDWTWEVKAVWMPSRFLRLA